jgi:hypothetical protein
VKQVKNKQPARLLNKNRKINTQKSWI